MPEYSEQDTTDTSPPAEQTAPTDPVAEEPTPAFSDEDHDHDHDESHYADEPYEADEHVDDHVDHQNHDPMPTPELPAHDPGADSGDKRDEEATISDLEDSDVDLQNPMYRSTEAEIHIADHDFEVEVEGDHEADFINSVQEINSDDIDRLKKILAEETARRGFIAPRPFRDVDKETLMVLQNAIRGELASR